MPTMKRTPSRHHARPKSSMGSSLVLCFFVCCLMVMGLLLQLVLAPQGAGGPSTNSILSIPTASTLTLSQKIAKLVPRFTEKADGTDGIDEDLAVPPYEKEFWSPIDVLDVSNTPIVVLCKLNFKKYSQAPHLSPMFKDLVGNSDCKGGNRRRENLRQQVDEIRNNPQLESNRVVEPSGFVFHESRVGSTLMANFLASNPYAMVFSESQPMANAILHCESCSREYNIQLFRDVTRLMGRSPFHTHLFFKFQSITVTQMGIALEAFPEVPWVFLYREPAQTMMSHMDPLKNNNGNAPCMRSKRHPPQDVKDSIARHASGSTPNEAWCAAHLNMLCTHAIRNLEKWGSYLDRNGSVQGVLRQRGLIINYDSMPGIVPKAILPHFGVHPVPSYWLRKISQESQMYSKSRGSKKHTFQSDSEDKSTRATEQINKYADLILGPTYELLQRKGGEALRRARPGLFVGGDGGAVKWKEFSPLPPLDGAGAGTGAGVGVGAGTGASGGGQGVVAGVLARFNANVGDLHSHIDKQTEFKAWAPFANHHSSVSKHPAECPIHPSANYPKSFSMLDISHNWNPDNTDIPPTHYDTLCHFDYTNATQLRSAYNYRTAEKPFVAYNIPEIDAVAKKWSDIDYLSKKLGHKAYRTETSISNHFMYWRNAKGKFLRTEEGKGWTPPTNIVKNTFDEWVELAVKNHNKSMEEREHQYFRVSSDSGNSWLFDELPFFKPVKNLLLVDPREQKGIHCRFGMRSVIAEAHFDGSRNSVVELAGMRRWILTHPNQCKDMHMLDSSHPSGRHSQVDWSKPDTIKFPNYAKVKGNEVILTPGDFLYIPTYWIHYIVSLNINVQCNTRSGKSDNYDRDIAQCGFRS